MKRYVFAVLSCISIAVNGTTVLKKAYFHQGGRQDGIIQRRPHIELANLVFYFERAPRIESSIVQKNGKTTQQLFLPDVVVAPDSMKALEAIQKQAEQQPFFIAFHQINDSSRKGLQITLEYSTQRVGVKYDHFNSIGLQKGVAFRFYNKALISKMNQIGTDIITTACVAPRVFIDCGHGGIDRGAVSNGIREKDICLDVGMSVSDLLNKQGITVALSRNCDEFVPLDTRTTHANQSYADLFVSIHANSASSVTAHGIETFFFDADLLKDGECFFPNIYIKKHARDQQLIKQARSNQLARVIHTSLIAAVRDRYCVVDRSIKPAMSQVLLGTQMPSILIEVGFITHPDEARFLAQKEYQETIARGISAGVMHYLGRA